jgi:two-component system, NarL family, response regulator DevR
MTAVYLVDDFTPGLVLLHDALARLPRLSVVGTAGTLAAASEGIARSHPDVAVIDDVLPDGEGVELCRQLRDAMTGIASILYAVSERPGLRQRALGAGASAVLLKNIDTSELVAMILALDPHLRRDARR